MALFIDMHKLGDGVSLDEVAKAHQADLATQGDHGVDYQRYWVDEAQGTVFCLVEAPSAEAATAVHKEATASSRMHCSRSRKDNDHSVPSERGVGRGAAARSSSAVRRFPASTRMPSSPAAAPQDRDGSLTALVGGGATRTDGAGRTRRRVLTGRHGPAPACSLARRSRSRDSGPALPRVFDH